MAIRIRPEDGKQNALGTPPRRMVARYAGVNGIRIVCLPPASWNMDGSSTPIQRSLGTQVYEVLPLFLPLVSSTVVTFRHLDDVGIGLPSLCLHQNLPEPVGHRDGHLLAGLELLHPDAPSLQVDAVPLKEDAVLESLSGIHSDVIDDSNFRLVNDSMPGIFKDFENLLLLFA